MTDPFFAIRYEERMKQEEHRKKCSPYLQQFHSYLQSIPANQSVKYPIHMKIPLACVPDVFHTYPAFADQWFLTILLQDPSTFHRK
jgi:hypothetical protein